MKQYFLHDGQNQIGPFSTEELKERNITGETYVWKEGMKDWVKANEIPELSMLVAKSPPPFKSSIGINESPNLTQLPVRGSGAFKAGNWIGRNWKKLSIFIVLIVIAAMIINRNGNSNDNFYPIQSDSSSSVREKTPEELRMELEMKEKENPREYLNAHIVRRKNLIGENVFEGTISNEASAAVFKDITVEIIYLSKTRAKIGSNSFTVYEVLGPKQSVEIKKVKLFPPDNTDDYNINIVSAKSVD